MEDDFKDYEEYYFLRQYPDAPDQAELAQSMETMQTTEPSESMDGMQLAAGPSPDKINMAVQNMPLETSSETTMRRMAEDQQAGVTGQIIPQDRTLHQNLVSRTQQALIDNLGIDNYKARKLAETIFGGESSNLPLGIGLTDFTPAAIPMAFQESGISAGQALESAGRGEYGTAAAQYGMGVLQGAEAIPGVKLATTAAKKIGSAVKDAAPIAGKMVEDYLTKTGVILKAAPDAPAIEVSTAPKLNTPAFKKWFGDSKIVDEKGQPLVVYHGSATGKIEEFNTKGPGRFYGPGAYFAFDAEDAAHYARNAERRNRGIAQTIYPVYLSIKNPMPLDIAMQRKILDRKTKDKNWLKTIIPELKIKIMEAKYDGFILKDGDGKLVSAVAFNPEQIKSVFNKGNFNPKDPRILYGGGVAGTGAAVQDKEQK